MPRSLVLGDEEPQLVGQVEVGLVVGRGGQQDALAVVLADVILDGAVALALAVAQVVAFVDQDEPIAAGGSGSSLVTRLIDSTRPRSRYCSR